ncbi:hypothetical protein ACFVZM_06705 [Streptomyces sioyaensis]|uniref:hypothetical protein n=1 Tax=Streptomyces sioyaensis TaxID=67364 RepID=UPI0036B6B5C7
MMEIYQNYELGTVDLTFDRVAVYERRTTRVGETSVRVVLEAADYERFTRLLQGVRSAKTEALESDLVRTTADLLTARKDLAEFHRELGIERDDHAAEIAELKAVVVAQARRLATLEGGTA